MAKTINMGKHNPVDRLYPDPVLPRKCCGYWRVAVAVLPSLRKPAILAYQIGPSVPTVPDRASGLGSQNRVNG